MAESIDSILLPFPRNAYPVVCACGEMVLSTDPRDRGRLLKHTEHAERAAVVSDGRDR